MRPIKAETAVHGWHFAHAQSKGQTVGWCSSVSLAFIVYYYMALSHKDWELPNSRIWLAKMDIDRGLDFPI